MVIKRFFFGNFFNIFFSNIFHNIYYTYSNYVANTCIYFIQIIVNISITQLAIVCQSSSQLCPQHCSRKINSFSWTQLEQGINVHLKKNKG